MSFPLWKTLTDLHLDIEPRTNPPFRYLDVDENLLSTLELLGPPFPILVGGPSGLLTLFRPWTEEEEFPVLSIRLIMIMTNGGDGVGVELIGVKWKQSRFKNTKYLNQQSRFKIPSISTKK